MLTVSGLVKTYRGRAPVQAVRNVDLDIAAGAFFTLLGPSGCGKSTILRCVAGLDRPDAGEIRIGEEIAFSAAARRNLPAEKRRIGMVFQSYAIWPHMTVFDNAAFPLRQARPPLPAAPLRAKVGEMLERVGLGGLEARWATHLSGGQQQRLALARALLREPQVLLLDEPLSNLDAGLRTTLRRELKSFQRQLGITTLYVTHDQTEALSLSDGIAVMREGLIVQAGPPYELYENPLSSFVAGFIGNANLLSGRVRERGEYWLVDCAFGTLLSAPPRNGLMSATHVCIRPEDVAVLPAPPERETVNVFTGRIGAVDFVGDSCECAVNLRDATLRTRVHRSVALPQGTEVWVSLPPRVCHLVEADQA